MVKKILIALILIIPIAGVGVYLYLHPSPMQGSVDNSHTVTLYLGNGTYFDVLVPNEATLIETDEATVYRYDLLTVGVQDMEPSSKCKKQVEGRWIFAASDEKFLIPSMYSFEHNVPYSPTLGECLPEGEPPTPTVVENPITETFIFGIDDYIIAEDAYGVWDVIVTQALTRLAQLTGQDSHSYFVSSDTMYASYGDYTVGVIYKNYNTHQVIIAKGQRGTDNALHLLTQREGVQ